MKLRHNEYCPIHRSLSRCGRERTHRARSLQPSFEETTHITQADTGNFDRPRNCANS
jgi:hypothetical protein